MNRRHFLGTASVGAASSIAMPAIARANSQAASGDIALVRDILTTLHPGLYRYASPKNIDSGLAKLDRDWAGRTLEARYLSLSRFLATVKCGHSYANFFNQKAAVKAELFDRKSRLPFAFTWIGGQMVVIADQSGTGKLPRGTVVRTLNGVAAEAMLTRLMPYVRADGNNDAKRRALLSTTGADELETFDIFHGLLYGSPASGIHRLQVRIPGSTRDTLVDLPALTLAQRQGFIPKKDYRGDAPVWDWTLRDDGIAVLTMDGWALYDSKWDWESWLNDRLDSLKGAKGLIVDIRENEGGNDCGDLILQRLGGKDIVKPTANRLVRYAKVPEKLNPVLDTWDNSFRDWGDQVERYDDRYYRLKKWEDGGTLAAKGPRIDVPLAVLTSAQNSSATFQFAYLCRASGLGTLVGEATGGNQRGINGGAFFFARLPQSGIEFDVPLVGYFPQGNMPDAGIEPDIKVAITVGAIASAGDPQLSAAVAYLRRK